MSACERTASRSRGSTMAPLPPTLGPPQKTIARALPSGAQHAMSETAAAIALPVHRAARSPSRPSDSPGALVRAFSLAIAAAAAAVNELGGGAAAGPPKAPWWGGAPKGCGAAAAPPKSCPPSGAGGGREVVRSGSPEPEP